MKTRINNNEYKLKNKTKDEHFIKIKYIPIFILLKFIIILIPNTIILSNCSSIELKVNVVGNIQIISNDYNIDNYPPYKIIINNDVQILRDRKIIVENKDDLITIQWNSLNQNLSYMFANIFSITYIYMKDMFEQNSNISYMFYNCINLKNFTITNKQNNAITDMKYTFFNCTSLEQFSFLYFRFNNNYIDMSYSFYNCRKLKNITYNNNFNIKIKNLKYSFYNCSSLDWINLNKFEMEESINISYAFYNCHTFQNISINNNNFKINDMRYLFYNNTSLEKVDIKFNADLSDYYNMSYAFYNCKHLNDLEINDWLIKPNDMRSMFYNCSELNFVKFILKESDNNVNMTKMFFNCNKMKQIDFISNDNDNYYDPTDLHAMFYNCTNLTSVNLQHFKTDKVQDMSYMFYNCLNFEHFEREEYFTNYLLKTTRGMFQNCEKITSFELTRFNTSNVEIMWAMFKGCSNLNYIDLSNFDTSQVSDMESMFEGCSNLNTISLSFNTTKVQYMNKMFKDCINLKSVYFPNIITTSVGTMHQMFYNCQKLQYLNLYSLIDRGQSIIDMFKNASNDFQICVKEHENIPNIFDTIYNLANTKRDCSNNCYNVERVEIIEKKYCCPKYKYLDKCYDKCPSKTKTDNINDKICNFFDCQYFYNYEQDDCINEGALPVKFFLNDTESKTIDKCHKDCLRCKGKGIDGNSNCTQCIDGLYIYLGNCYNTCIPGYYKVGEENICKCFNKKCLNCTEESLEYNLCISCNKEDGYYEKSDEKIYINNYKECYQSPKKYFLNVTKDKYEPCYHTCEFCTQLGNYDAHYCSKCDTNFSFAIPMTEINSSFYNCYPDCPYYYYFDDNNTYQCTEGPECPKEYEKLVSGDRRCIKSCLDLPTKKKEFRKVCYEECPVEELLLIEKGNLCRSKCPNFEEPFEMVEKQICVSNCTIMERKDKLCITNYAGNRSNAEVQDKVFSNLIDDILTNFNYSYIDDYTSIILEEQNHTYEILTTNSQVNNPNTSTIYFKNCETNLKNYYGIRQEESLYVLKLDAYRDGQTGPTVEYQIFYPLNGLKLEQLDLTLCEGDGISLLISFNMTEGEDDLYNKNSGYYNDICYPYTSSNGTDMTLGDRQQEFSNNNKSLCEEGCEFVKYHYDTGQAECSCDVKTNLPIVSEITVDKTKLYQFLDLKKIANFDVMKCYNLVISIDGVKGNIGFYVFFPTFVVYFISIIIFYVKENKKIKLQVNEIVFAMRNLKYLNAKIIPKEPEPVIKNKFVEPLFLTFLKKKKVDIDENFGMRKTRQETSKTEFIENNLQININIEKNSKKNKKRIKNKKLNEIKELDEKENKYESKNKNQTVEEKMENKKSKLKMKNIFNDDDSLNAPPSKNKIQAKTEKNKSIKNIKTTQAKETSDNNDNIFNNDIVNINLDTEGDKAPSKSFTDKQKQKIKDILKYNDDELNDLTYKEAVKYDHRTFFQFYFALLKSKHNLITLIESKDYNAKIIKVFLLFFSFAFNYAVNALFFDDDTMHKIHEDGGNFNFWYQLPQIAYSTIISYILENFLNFLALSEDEVLNVKREKIVKNVGRKGKETLRRLSLKFMLFYFISFFLLVLFWYYVSCFCAVYKNTQYHLIKDTLVSFGTSFLYPFGMYLIPPMFRIPALKSYSKAKAAMYKFSQLLLFF